MQYYKEIPALNDDGAFVNFDGANATDSFNFKNKITGQTADNNDDGNIAGRADIEIMVPLKYLSNFWRTLEMPLIYCEIELTLKWSGNCVIIYTDVIIKSYIYTNRDKSLCSSSYFINSR